MTATRIFKFLKSLNKLYYSNIGGWQWHKHCDCGKMFWTSSVFQCKCFVCKYGNSSLFRNQNSWGK